VLGAPFAGVGRIDADDRDAAAGRHRGQAGPEFRGGDTGHGAPEPFPPRAAADRFAADRTCVDEVEVLDDHRRAPGVGRGIEQGGDCCEDPPVTLGSGQPGGVEGDRDRFPDRIARVVAFGLGRGFGRRVALSDPVSYALANVDPRLLPGPISIL
jgi:hypothetical protein